MPANDGPEPIEAAASADPSVALLIQTHRSLLTAELAYGITSRVLLTTTILFAAFTAPSTLIRAVIFAATVTLISFAWMLGQHQIRWQADRIEQVLNDLSATRSQNAYIRAGLHSYDLIYPTVRWHRIEPRLWLAAGYASILATYIFN
jgi:hypothetical protein